MKHLIILFLVFTTYGSFAQQGEWVWVKETGSSSTISESPGNGFVLTGTYSPNYNWTNPPLYPYLSNTSGFVANFDEDGNWTWYHDFGYDDGIVPSTMQGKGSVTTPSGAVYTNLLVMAPYVFEEDTFADNWEAASPGSIIAKYDKTGNLLWHNIFTHGDSVYHNSFVRVLSICTDYDENLYVRISLGGNIQIGDTIIETGSPFDFTAKGFLCCFDSVGNLDWIHEQSRVANSMNDLFYNPTSNKLIEFVYIQDSLFYNENTIYNPYYVDNTKSHLCLMTFEPSSGELEDYFIYPSGFSDLNSPHKLDFDDEGNYLFSTKCYKDTFEINGQLIECDDTDFLIWKVKPNGEVIWLRHFKGDYNQKSYGLLVHSSSDIFIFADLVNSLIQDEDTLWTGIEKNTIIQLDSAGNFKNFVGNDDANYKVFSFAFDQDDLIIYGRNLTDSLGEWPITGGMLARYNPTNIGIEEIKHLDENLLVYPNPASLQLKIESSFTISQISIYSITGQFVKEQAANGKMVSLNVSDLLPGNYIVRCIGDQQEFARKFVVLR